MWYIYSTNSKTNKLTVQMLVNNLSCLLSKAECNITLVNLQKKHLVKFDIFSR